MQGSVLRKIVLVSLVGLLSACAHHPKVENPVQPLEAADFWRDQTARRAFLGTFSGKLKMGYEGKKQSVSGKGRIVGNYPQNFRLELRDPIGRLHYVLIQKGSSVVAYFPRNKQAGRENNSGRTYFKRVLGTGIAFNDIVAISAGVLPTKWEKVKFSTWEWDKEQGAFRGVLEQGGEKVTVWVDSANTAIQSLVMDMAGETVEAEFTDREPCCETPGGFHLGYEAKLKLPKQQTAVGVTWDTISKPTQDIPASAFEFTPAAGDKVSELK
jgi:outer membrane lipoprotein-sorting protein